MLHKDKFTINRIIKNFKLKKNSYIYPLLDNAFSDEDIFQGMQVLLTRRITMDKIVEKFEKKFAKFVGSKYALMVNSGSSANLLATFASCNPLRKKDVFRMMRPSYQRFVGPHRCGL